MGDAEGVTFSVGMGMGAMLNALDWDHVREEVDRECRSRIVLIGATGVGKSTLLNRLKGLQTFEVSETSEVPPAVEDYGLFAVIDLPAQGPDCAPSGGLESDPAWLALQSADHVLWMLDGEAGLRAWEHEWLCRVRATGKLTTVVLNKCDQVHDAHEIQKLGQTLGCAVIPICARDGTNVASYLLPHIVEVNPDLTTALGRESPAWRRVAAQRVIRRSITLSGLVGAEPVPLLDIPFQALIQLRLVLRLAAIYGQPLGDRYSRELLATMVSGVALRYLGQELAKTVPIAGWAASGVLAGAGTWAIGRVATEYFENGRRVPLPDLRAAWEQWRNGHGRGNSLGGSGQAQDLPLQQVQDLSLSYDPVGEERRDGQDSG
jgi:small GTP-binding protein